MKNLWDPAAAARCTSDLELRVYSSRLLGKDRTLVLHGGGNTSVKITANGEARIREIYGDDVVIVPYVMPGFDLAKVCARKFQAEAKPATIGIVLLNHGIFSFSATAEESYGRMIALVDRAEEYLKQREAWETAIPETQ